MWNTIMLIVAVSTFKGHEAWWVDDFVQHSSLVESFNTFLCLMPSAERREPAWAASRRKAKAPPVTCDCTSILDCETFFSLHSTPSSLLRNHLPCLVEPCTDCYPWNGSWVRGLWLRLTISLRFVHRWPFRAFWLNDRVHGFFLKRRKPGQGQRSSSSLLIVSSSSPITRLVCLA